MIFVDRREGSADLAPLLKTKAIITEMKFGDVSFTGSSNDEIITVGIERKKIRDLINSIATGRLSGYQIPGMMEMYDRSYLIIEGIWKGDKQTGEILVSRDYGKSYVSLYMGNRKWTAEAVHHYLTSIETFFGIPYRFTIDARDTAKTVDSLYRWWQNITRHSSHLAAHNKKAGVARTTKAIYTPVTLNKATGANKDVRKIALQLPNIDTKRSIDIANTFKCVQDLFDATDKEWLAIPGIGKVSVESIMKFLHKR